MRVSLLAFMVEPYGCHCSPSWLSRASLLAFMVELEYARHCSPSRLSHVLCCSPSWLSPVSVLLAMSLLAFMVEPCDSVARLHGGAMFLYCSPSWLSYALCFCVAHASLLAFTAEPCDLCCSPSEPWFCRLHGCSPSGLSHVYSLLAFTVLPVSAPLWPRTGTR